MQRQLLVLSFGFAALLAALQAARAETIPCGKRAEIVAQLSTRYHETRRSIGVAVNNAVLEVFASEESGTFSILVTLPSGQSCLLASGEDYQPLSEVPGQGV